MDFKKVRSISKINKILKDKNMSQNTSLDHLPLALSAEDVAQVLGISRAKAYELMHSKYFPTIKIGKRMSVPKDKLIEWMERQIKVEK